MNNRHRWRDIKWQNSNLTVITHDCPVLCLCFNLFFVFITTYMHIYFILISEFDKNKVFWYHKCFFDIIHGIFVYDVLLSRLRWLVANEIHLFSVQFCVDHRSESWVFHVSIKPDFDFAIISKELVVVLGIYHTSWILSNVFEDTVVIHFYSNTIRVKNFEVSFYLIIVYWALVEKFKPFAIQV